MADIKLELDLLGGGDQPYASGILPIRRSTPGVDPGGYVDGSWRNVPLSNPATVLGENGFYPLERGVFYDFITPGATSTITLQMPNTATAKFSDLAPTSIPLPSPGEIIDEAVAQAIEFGDESSAVVDAKVSVIRGLPAYAPAASTGSFDPKFNVYNWKPENTRRVRASLGRAASGQLAEWACIGDSSMTGCIGGTSYDRLHAWPIAARDELARHGIPVCGTGMVRAQEATVVDSRWSQSGTWTGTLWTHVYTTQNGATRTFTTNLAGDRVTVDYYDNADGSIFSVSVNGASSGAGFQSMTTSGPAGWKKMTLSAAIAIGQTVVVTKVSGATTLLRDVCVWNSTGGLLLHNVAQGGSKAYGNTNAGWVDASSYVRLGQSFANLTVSQTNPDVVICTLSGNDKKDGVTDQLIVDSLTVIRARYPNSDFILGASQQLSDAYFSAATWETTVARLYGLADELDVPLIDQRARLGTYAQVVARGLNGDTDGHLKVEAQVDLGRGAGMLFAS